MNPSAPGPAPGLGSSGSPQPRFVQPVPPVRALSTPDTGSPEAAVKLEAQEEDDLTVESLSPRCGHVGGGDQAEPPFTPRAARQWDQDRGQDGQAAGRRLPTTVESKNLDNSTSSPCLPLSNELQRRKLSDATSLAKLDVLEVAEADVEAGGGGGGGGRPQRCHGAANGALIDTSYSVQVQHDKAVRSAPLRGPLPRRGKSITITSTRQVLPPASAIRSERWSLGGPAELFAGTKSTWDIVLGRGGPATPPPAAPGSGSGPGQGVRTVSLSLADRRHRRASCPDQPQHDDVFLSEDSSRDRDLSSEPVLPDRLVRFVYPERSGCPSCSRDAGVQVSGPPPLQLHVLPPHRCRCGGGGGAASRPGACAWLAQLVLCQAGLAVIILAIALVGAAAFNATEGPHEEEQFQELARQQVELVVSLATELRQVVPEEAAWRATITRSVERHEAMVLRAAAAGYGEGGSGEGPGGARIWTFPGGLLFAASLLTTLGFGAPVPRTPLGRMAAVLLAVLGIPLNVILALQLGRLLCTRLPRLLPLLTPRPHHPHSPACLPCEAMGLARTAHSWLPLLVPALSLLLYYLVGMVLFGTVLALPASEWLLFPLSLTAAGGVARVPGWVRVLYAAYLEGGILLAAVAVALLQAPATTATTDLAIKLGILDLRDYYSS